MLVPFCSIVVYHADLVTRPSLSQLHVRCPNDALPPSPRSGPSSSHRIASWAPRSPRPLDTNDYHNRTVVVLSYSSDTMTRNLRPTRIGADAACLANSHSSCEASNYALATTKATGDLLPQAFVRVSLTAAATSHACVAQTTWLRVQFSVDWPMLSRETELATFLPLVNINMPWITTKLVPARQPTAMTWAGLG
jgi:hypothetical protein